MLSQKEVLCRSPLQISFFFFKRNDFVRSRHRVLESCAFSSLPFTCFLVHLSTQQTECENPGQPTAIFLSSFPIGPHANLGPQYASGEGRNGPWTNGKRTPGLL